MKALTRTLLTVGVVYLLTVGAQAASAAAPVQIGCDPLDPAVCLQPFPNDYFTVADPSTDTGRRVNFDVDVDAAQRRRQADRPERVEPQRRLQPGRA